MGKYDDTMYVNLYETHPSYIRNIKSYRCSKCEDSLWKYPSWLERHERTCNGGVRRMYKGGVYHTTPPVFKRFDDEGIIIVASLRLYPYRASFDGDHIPADSNHMQWIARHVPMSVSLASNLSGHETPHCYVTDSDSDKLVGSMVSDLIVISDAAFDVSIPSYNNVLKQLEVRKEVWDEAERDAPKEDKSK